MTTPFHSHYWAQQLTLKASSDSLENLSRSFSGSRVDLNPHQVDAALFAFRSPLSKGAILADEVGLGKTIEAGLVISQKWAEQHRRILLILPATLRKQWQIELDEKFYLPSVVLDSKSFNQVRKDGLPNPFRRDPAVGAAVVICSYHFAALKAKEIREVPWDLVVMGTLHGHLDRARTEPLGEEAYLDLKQAINTLAFLNQEVERKGASLEKLRHILFGPRTESTSAVTGAAVARREKVPLEGFHSGDPCPNPGCDGKVYPQKDPATLIRVTGVAPIWATISELERWRCNLCEDVFTAPAPEGVGEMKYDASVPALIGELRYGGTEGSAVQSPSRRTGCGTMRRVPLRRGGNRPDRARKPGGLSPKLDAEATPGAKFVRDRRRPSPEGCRLHPGPPILRYR